MLVLEDEVAGALQGLTGEQGTTSSVKQFSHLIHAV